MVRVILDEAGAGNGKTKGKNQDVPLSEKVKATV
jgi:hypothetical protein